MLTGTNSYNGVPISYQYSYNGSVYPWGSVSKLTSRIQDVSPITNNAESVDNSYQISNLQISFVDHDSSIWEALGHGTTCLNKDVAFQTYFGGDVESVLTFGGNRKSRLQGTNGQLFPLHTGKITKVSRKDRLVTIESKSKMKLLGDLTWNFPYSNSTYAFDNVGSFYFYDTDLFSSTSPALSYAKFQVNDVGDDFSVIARAATTSYTDFQGSGYAVTGRDYTTMVPAFGYYMGSNFAWTFPKVQLSATFLGKYDGTIGRFDDYDNPTQEEADLANQVALSLGYPDYITANGSTYATMTDSGTWIFVNRTRLSFKDGTLAGSNFTFQQSQLTMRGNPATIFKEIIAGAMVWPFFGTSDIEGTSYADFVRLTTYQDFACKIDPTEDAVLPYFKDLVDSNIALFSVSEDDKFQIIAYTPRNLNQLIPSLGSNEIVSSEISNDIEDWKNRITLDYDFYPDDDKYPNKFRRHLEATTSTWSHDNDLPLVIQSKWLRDNNEAEVFKIRTIERHKNGIPRLSLTLPLARLGVQLGSLYRITDIDTSTSDKAIQITGYTKDVNGSKDVVIEGWDAEALYQRKGFAFFGTKPDLPGDTGGTNNTAIWGTRVNGNDDNSETGTGTSPGINTALFGTCFTWF